MRHTTPSAAPHVDDANDSVTRSGKGKPSYSGKSITERAENHARDEPEPGRVGERSTLRYATGVGVLKPIDPKMPTLIP